MTKLSRIAAVLLVASAAMWPAVTQAKPNHPPHGPPPYNPGPPIKLPGKPTSGQLATAVDRINSSPAARARLAGALASHDNGSIAAIFKSVNVVVPPGTHFNTSVEQKAGGGKGGKGGKGDGSKCYKMTIDHYDGFFPVMKLTPAPCKT